MGAGGEALKDRVRGIAAELGFDDCRVAAAEPARHGEAFRAWLEEGCHADMAWMERNVERRIDPRLVQEGARSVIVLGLNYFVETESKGRGRIARYAWGQDYHDVVTPKLKAFDERLRELGGLQRYYVDTGPVLERDHSTEAGLGWNGKSTVQIHRRLGTWFLLAELITTLDLPPDEPFGDHCGKCVRCMEACPTDAIPEPHKVDARRCLSYLTIENRGPIPEAYREALGDRIFGCDECLEVCPWNRFAQASREAAFEAREFVSDWDLRDFLGLDEEGFRALFRKSPVKRAKRRGFLRNVCVALGNVGTAGDLPALERVADDEEELIAEHARWAIERIREREGRGM